MNGATDPREQAVLDGVRNAVVERSQAIVDVMKEFERRIGASHSGAEIAAAVIDAESALAIHAAVFERFSEAVRPWAVSPE
ncbi:MAG: hypothetical protein AB7P99_06945 [Vicinamibacterales bacterium]